VFEFLDPTSHLSACGAELKLIQDSNAVKKIVLQLREYLKGGRTTVFQGTSTLHKLVQGQEC
jgi:hypothetical protein